jgi:hypothetical protein
MLIGQLAVSSQLTKSVSTGMSKNCEKSAVNNQLNADWLKSCAETADHDWSNADWS